MKRIPKPRDPNRPAASIVSGATGKPAKAAKPPEKNPAAVALGKLGGAKGGAARALSLSPARRSAIARKAAKTRWNAGPKGT